VLRVSFGVGEQKFEPAIAEIQSSRISDKGFGMILYSSGDRSITLN
tara:strand:+ start:1051 stop:1188 length:138 start_codon:yes stop_codon:yes gene_type:complete